VPSRFRNVCTLASWAASAPRSASGVAPAPRVEVPANLGALSGGPRFKLGNFARILAVCLALAAYSNWSLAVRERDRQATRPSQTEAVAGIPLIRLGEAQALWQQPSTLFVDVRSATDYEVGHIAGAISMPWEEFEQRLSLLRVRLERATVLVVYCKSVDCGKSLWTALGLRNAGLLQVKIYPDGWNEWYNRGLPIAGLGR
jgi:rhodanese-related sulfurtransferase